MKTLIFLFLFLIANTLSAQQLNMRVAAPSPPQITANTIGAGNNTTYYYMVIANYPSGSSQSQIAVVQNGNSVLSSTNYNQIGWQPLTGALTYDVLRLPSLAFTGTCTCSVTTGSTANSFSDQGGSLSSYTVGTSALGAGAYYYIDNTDYAFPKVRLSIGSAPQGANANHLGEVPSGSALPSYCTPGDIFIKTAAVQGAYQCTAANTWTEISVQFVNCGSTATCSDTVESGSLKVATGTGTLVTGSPSTFVVTSISPAFTSSSTYTCVAQDTTTIANNIGVLAAGYVSGSAVTFTGPNTNTDGFRYTCVGY